MITFDYVEKLYKYNNLIGSDGQVFYGYIDNKKTDLAKINIYLKNNKEKKIIAVGISREELIIIPYSSLNKEFLMDQKSIFSLNNITKVKIKKVFSNYYLSFYLNDTLFLTLNFAQRHIENKLFLNNVIAFLNRVKLDGKNILLKELKDNNMKQDNSAVIPASSNAVQNSSANNQVQNNPASSNLGTNNNINFNLKTTIMPTSLLVNPLTSEVTNLSLTNANIKVLNNEITLEYEGQRYQIPFNKITNIIERRSNDLTHVEVIFQSHNQVLFKIILGYNELANKTLTNNLQNLINQFNHTGEGLNNIILNKKIDNKNSILSNIIWFIILVLIILAIYYFLK